MVDGGALITYLVQGLRLPDVRPLHILFAATKTLPRPDFCTQTRRDLPSKFSCADLVRQ